LDWLTVRKEREVCIDTVSWPFVCVFCILLIYICTFAASVPAASQSMVCAFPHCYFHGPSICTAWTCSISRCAHVGSFVSSSGTFLFVNMQPWNFLRCMSMCLCSVLVTIPLLLLNWLLDLLEKKCPSYTHSCVVYGVDVFFVIMQLWTFYLFVGVVAPMFMLLPCSMLFLLRKKL